MKKKLKRVLCVILVAVMSLACFTAFTGCGSGNYVSIVFWHYYTGEQAKQLTEYVETFNNTVGSKKKIVIIEESLGSIKGLETALNESIAGNVNAQALPDMFMAFSDTALTVNSVKPLADLESYFKEKELSQYVQGYLDEGRIDGAGIKVFPIAKSTEILTVNATYFENFMKEYNAANTDKVSWSDFDTIEGITALGGKYYRHTGKALYARDATDNYFFSGVKQLGGDLFKVDSGSVSTAFDSSDSGLIRKLWDNYYVPYVKGWFSHDGRFGTDCLYSLETIAALGSTSSAGYIKDKVSVSKDEERAVDIRILPAPVFKDGSKVYTQQGGGISVIKSDKKKEKACVEFIKWFTEESRNIEFAGSTGYLPVKTAANDMDKIKNVLDEGTSEIFVDVLDKAVGMIKSADLMYACRPFIGSSQARDVFKYDFNKKCKDDFYLIADLVEEAEKLTGKEREEKLAEAELKRADLLSDESFNAWYEAVRNQLKGIIGK